MKILAFAGSNSSTSINKKLVTHVASFFDDHSVETLDLNNYDIPLFSVDKLAKTGIPQLAIDFAQKIDKSDLLLISLAENNGAYSTAFKNIYDWISIIPERKAFGNKSVFLLATSPGERGGGTVLELAKNTLPYYGAQVVDSFSLPSFYQNFDESIGISNPTFAEDLKLKIEKLKK